MFSQLLCMVHLILYYNFCYNMNFCTILSKSYFLSIFIFFSNNGEAIWVNTLSIIPDFKLDIDLIF